MYKNSMQFLIEIIRGRGGGLKMSRRPKAICFKCDSCGKLYRVGKKHECAIISEKGKIRMKDYIVYTDVTKEVLDKIQMGDLVRVNDWKKPMRVKGVSENYAVMIENQFGKTYYSVIEKKVWDGIRRNAMIGGHYHCGKDDWIFGDSEFGYNFDDTEAVARYLQTFECGKTHLSVRNAIPILEIHVKKE